MRALALLPLLLLAIACNTEPRYQIVSADGLAYRLDTRTGEVWYVRGVASCRVHDPEETAKMYKEGALAEQPFNCPE